MEILEALETEVNEQDLEGVLALFDEDAVWEESYQNRSLKGIENIDFGWEVYFMTPVTSEFRDISVEGDTATFTWVEFRSAMTKLWPTIIEVQNGKITHVEWPEEPVRKSTDIE
jgi:ketosteroid isomerase-like protein